jgi:hypothetical protein
MITKYFSQKEREKRKKLRQIDKEIVKTEDYNELVKLVKIYNRVKNEN